jgi:uncharacterized membrane protein
VNNKPILFALIFAGTGIFVFGNAALFVFHGATFQHMAVGLLIIIVLGIAGLIVGWTKRQSQGPRQRI